MNLSLQNLSFWHPTGPKFRDISLELPGGSLTCLLGPNGSGKSTLLKALMRLIPLRGGGIFLRGSDGRTVDLPRLSRRELARRLAYVPQTTPVAAVSVYEVLMMGRSPYMRIAPSRADRLIVEKNLERLGLAEWRDRHIDELSGGERQKVLIGMALVQETPVILLDEPASSLDIRYQIELYEMLRGLCAKEEKVIVVAEHDLNLAARYSDRVCVMHGAAIVAQGTPHDVFTRMMLREVYGVDSTIGTDGQGRTTIINTGLAKDTGHLDRIVA